MYGFMISPHKSFVMIFSLSISLLTTAFTSATIAYDIDLDPYRRKNQPAFYGYVPGKAKDRMHVFIALCSISFFACGTRCMGIILLTLTFGGKVAFFEYLAEIAMLLLFKIARKDFKYWVPVTGVMVYFGGVVARILCKVIVDFTTCLHYRHPFELGSLIFALSVVWAQAVCFISAKLYSDKFEEENGDGSHVPVSLLLLTIIIFSLSSFLSFALLFAKCTPGYKRTFFMTTTSGEYVCQLFKNSDDDAVKADTVFDTHESFHIPIKDDVRLWVQANYARWLREQKPWFVRFRSKIPLHYIPREATTVENRHRLKRRNSISVVHDIMGVEREYTYETSEDIVLAKKLDE